jgi:glycosyltransferase involved in cell wall biosynthesis
VASFALLSTGIAPEQHKNMKIAFIDIYKRIPISSGGDWWMFQLFADLARNNRVSTFYTSERSSEEGYLPKNISFDTHFLPSPFKWGRVSTWLDIIRPDALWDKAQIRDIEADCVFTLVYGYHIAAYIASKNGAPLVLVMHNVEWQYVKSMHSLWHLPMRILENWILNRVDAVITISPRDCDYAAKHASRRVFYIPPQPYAHVFSPDGARYDYGGDFFNVVFYGSFDRHQNRVALTFIANELVPALARANGAFKVHVFGSGKAPDDLLSGTGINFIGAVSDPGLYIRGADAIIIPIKNASGIKLRAVESLACGKPVVATPEAVQGLPQDLRAMTYVVGTADEFVEVLKGISDGRLANKTNSSLVRRRMQKDSVDDVLSYVSKKQHVPAVESK